MILNLTQHPASADQIAVGVADLAAIERIVQRRDKAPIPVIITEHVAEQDAEWRGPFGSKIGQVHRHQFPGDIGRVRIQRKMCACDHHIVGQNKIAKHRAIIGQPARFGGAGGGAQGGYEVVFGHGTHCALLSGTVPNYPGTVPNYLIRDCP